MNDPNPNPAAASAAPAAVAAAPPADAGNVGMAVAAGLVAALVGAILWAVVTVTTKYQIGFMAVGVGLLVAWAVRSFGKGSAMTFSYIGGALALLGCLLGNLLSACGFLAEARDVPLLPLVGRVLASPDIATSLLSATFSGMDLLFYAIAVYEGFKLSRLPAPAA